MRLNVYIFQARSFWAWLRHAGCAGDFPLATCGMAAILLCAVLHYGMLMCKTTWQRRKRCQSRVLPHEWKHSRGGGSRSRPEKHRSRIHRPEPIIAEWRSHRRAQLPNMNPARALTWPEDASRLIVVRSIQPLLASSLWLISRNWTMARLAASIKPKKSQ